MTTAFQELSVFWFNTHNLALALIVVICFTAIFSSIIFCALTSVQKENLAESIRKRRLVEIEIKRLERRRARYKAESIKDEMNQLHEVQNCHSFQRRRIFNREEIQLFYLVKDILRQPDFKNWHVHGQVSMGEIIKTALYDPTADRAYQSINSKRADMVVTDNFGTPAVLIEYQGDGHWGKDRATTEIRDKVKKVAATSAGLEWVEIFPTMSKEDRNALIVKSLRAHLDKARKTKKNTK